MIRRILGAGVIGVILYVGLMALMGVANAQHDYSQYDHWAICERIANQYGAHDGWLLRVEGAGPRYGEALALFTQAILLEHGPNVQFFPTNRPGFFWNPDTEEIYEATADGRYGTIGVSMVFRRIVTIIYYNPLSGSFCRLEPYGGSGITN